MLRHLFHVAGWVVLAALGGNAAALFGQASSSDRPFIIFINLDDADRALVEIDFIEPQSERRLPNLSRLAAEGRRFSNMHVTIPLCGPSRACLLTGQYAHQTRLMTNDPTEIRSRGVPGNFAAFRWGGPHGSSSQVYWENELGCWMRQAGYHTIFVGKYLHNGFDPGAMQQTWRDLHPPGWQDFTSFLGGRYFSPRFVRNGTFHARGDDEVPAGESAYRTHEEYREVARYIRRHVTTEGSPFLVYWAPFAPHRESQDTADAFDEKPGKGIIEPRYRDWWRELRQPRDPDLIATDPSGKPFSLQQLPPVEGRLADRKKPEMEFLDLLFRRRLLALRSVDDAVGELMDLLKSLRIADRTIIIITSDNGYHLGHQRHYGKAVPYGRSSGVPAIVWGPAWISPIAQPLDHLLAHIDWAPTLVEMAGGVAPPAVQGRSLYPLMIGEPPAAESWRPEGILVEHWERTPARGVMLDTTYCSLRLHREVYTQWADGSREYYDLARDPFELRNGIQELSPDRERHLVGLISELRGGMPHPLTFIERPFAADTQYSLTCEFAGIADYRSPIDRVGLVLAGQFDQGRTLYWNGVNWGESPATVDAELAHAGGLLTDWKYTLELSGEVPQSISLTACGRSVDGMEDLLPPRKSVVIKGAYPWCVVERPQDHDYVYRPDQTLPIVIAGWAEDDRPVRAVQLVIADRAAGRFWNGSGWQAETASVMATLQRIPRSTRVTFGYEFLPDEPMGTVHVIPRVLSRDRPQAIRGRDFWFTWSDH